MSKEKFLNLYKEKFLLIAGILCALIFLVIFAKFSADNLSSKIYYDKDFKSSYAKEDEKTINIETGKIIFTYGPYINLKKGTYNVKINYSTENTNSYDITSEHGGTTLTFGDLPEDKTSVTAEIEIKENIHDNGFEIRTYYNGNGKFSLKSVEISRNNISKVDTINLIGFTVFMIFLLFLVKTNFLKKKLYFFYIILISLLFFNFMLESLLNFSIGYFILIILTIVFIKFGNNVEKLLEEIKPAEIISVLIVSYVITSYLFLIKSEGSIETIDFIKKVGFSNVMFSTSVIFNIIFIIRLVHKKDYINYRITLFCILFYSVYVILTCANNLYFSIGITLIILYFIYYLIKDDKVKILDIKIKDTPAIFIILILFLIMFCFVAINTAYIHKTFGTSTYDFGIFIQMFENMAKTGLPVTTCERGELLSHFYIHFSPIYYLILPFYMILRSPEGLLIIQAFAVTQVIFPVYLISRKFKLPQLASIFLAAAVIILPAFIAPAYFDFHENKFLAVFILWFIYFMESKKKIGIFLFAALTLMVKEDAALYIIILSVYYIIAKKEYKIGFILLILSTIYFTAVMAFIQAHGRGLMGSHYGIYYLTGQEGVLKMFINILQNPILMIKNMFTEETFTFILYSMVPLLFVPLICKDYKNLILLIPFVFINIMTTYKYQYNINYQYNYGSSALLVLMFMLNLKSKKINIQYTACIAALFASFFMLYADKGENLINPKRIYKNNTAMYESMEADLKKYIPEDASVAAQTLILPHLYNHYELYMFDDKFDVDKYNVDYIVYYASDKDKFEDIIDKNKYELISSNNMFIYKKIF